MKHLPPAPACDYYENNAYGPDDAYPPVAHSPEQLAAYGAVCWEAALASCTKHHTGLELASIGHKHFGNPIPQAWYAAAKELLGMDGASEQPDKTPEVQAQHPHAEVLRAVADGVPISEFQGRMSAKTFDCFGKPFNEPFQDISKVLLVAMFTDPETVEIRRKQRTHVVNGFTVPAPLSKEPEPGEVYYFPVLHSTRLYDHSMWLPHKTNNDHNQRFFARGLCFETIEDAVANAVALLNIDPATLVQPGAQPILLRDLAEELDVLVPDLAREIARRGLGNYSTNMMVQDDVIHLMRRVVESGEFGSGGNP